MASEARPSYRCRSSTRRRRSLRAEYLVERASELLGQLEDVPLFDDERRREHHVLSAYPVDEAAHRVTDQTVLHRAHADALRKLEARIERLFRPAVFDQLESKEEAAATD